MQNHPKVTIIVPIYNTEKYLHKCLTSLQNQTFKDIEIICVDDGSTDNSTQIVQEFLKTDERFELIIQKNLYAGVARNNGIKNAKGDYIIFIDADDWCEPNMVEDIYIETYSKQTDISIFQFYNYDEQTKEIVGTIQGFRTAINSQYFDNTFSCEDTDGALFAWFNYGPCNKIFRRQFIIENRLQFQNTKVSNDVSFFFEAFSKAKKISLLNKPLSYYRINTGGSLCDIKWQHLDCRIEAFSQAEEKIKLLPYFDKIKYKFKDEELGSYIGFLNLYLKKDLENHYKNLKKHLNSTNKNLYSESELSKYAWYEDYNLIKEHSYQAYKVIKKYKLSKFCKKITKLKKRLLPLTPAYILNKNKTKKLISKYKYIHIMQNDKFCAPFIDFFNTYFDNTKHLFIFHAHFWEKEFPIPQYENILNLDNIKEVDIDVKSVEKIIFHGLFHPQAIDWLYSNPKFLQKSYWCIWGGDLYCRHEESDKEIYVKSNFKGYLTSYDKEYALNKYNFTGEVFSTNCIFPIKLEMIKKIRQEKTKKDFIQIQINNSADQTTLEILRYLEKFKDENLKIKTILSYGKKEFIKEIITEGKKLFADKFEPITEYMPPEEYIKSLAQNDILILNQNRQQGIGNITASLCLGTKVFIRNNVSTYKYLNENDFTIFDTLKIKDMDFNEFIANNKQSKQQNIENAEKLYDFEYLASQWGKIFESCAKGEFY